MNDQFISHQRVTFCVSDKCTLHCKKCAGYFPFYVKNPWHPNIEYLIESLDMAFQVFDEIEIINIEGGEPFVRKDLPILLPHFQKYDDQIRREIRFITNGTIIPSPELIAACKPFGEKIYVIVDDYGSKLSKNAAAVAQVLSENGIRNELRIQRGHDYYDGWIDLGSFENRNYTEQQQAHVYNLCKGLIIGAERQFVIKKGKIVPCARSMRLTELGVIQSHAFVDLFDGTDIRLKRDKLRYIKSRPYLEACGYCNGFSKESPRILAGEQYTDEELETLNDFDY